MAVGRLRERTRAREQLTVDEDDRGPEHNVLGEREPEREAALIHIDVLSDCVEDDAEQCPVCRVHGKADRAASTAEELDVRVVAAE